MEKHLISAVSVFSFNLRRFMLDLNLDAFASMTLAPNLTKKKKIKLSYHIPHVTLLKQYIYSNKNVF